jgi:hypothetical protein
VNMEASGIVLLQNRILDFCSLEHVAAWIVDYNERKAAMEAADARRAKEMAEASA